MTDECKWSVDNVKTVVAYCCREEDMADAGGVFVAHDIDSETIVDVLQENLLPLLQGPGSLVRGHESLARYGTRTRLVRRLSAFVSSFHGKPWSEVVSAMEAVYRPHQNPLVSANHLLNMSDAERVEAEQLLRRVAGAHPVFELLHRSMRRADFVFPAPTKHPKQVVVPVYMTVMIKKLSETRDSTGNVHAVGTIIQRPLLYDFQRLRLTSDNTVPRHFNMRLNEGQDPVGDAFVTRKIVHNRAEHLGAIWPSSSET